MDVFSTCLYVSGMPERPHTVALTMAHKTFCSPDWSWDNAGESSDTFDLWLVVQGRGTMTVRGRTYPLSAGSCFLIRMNEPCQARHDPADPLVVVWTFFRYRPRRPPEAELPPVHRHIRQLAFFQPLYEKAVAAATDPARGLAVAEEWMRAVLLALDDEDRQVARDAADDPESARRQRLQAILDRIQSLPGNSYPLSALARECACSTGHFTRLFRALTGQTPRDYLVNTRVQTACRLLRSSSRKLTRIAEELGYGDIFHFSRQFKARTGFAPSAYRRATQPTPVYGAAPVSSRTSRTSGTRPLPSSGKTIRR